MTTQEFLTFLIDAIALSFLALLVTDFIAGLIEIARTSATSSQQMLTADEIAKIFDAEPEIEQILVPDLPDPWYLPVNNEVREIAAPITLVPQIQVPLLLLPSAEPVSLPHQDDELLHRIDFDKLQLRSARKIAKVLEIPQKVNGRDQKLSDLKFGIEMKLQQPHLLPQNIVEEVRELIAV